MIPWPIRTRPGRNTVCELSSLDEFVDLDALVLAVGHADYREIGPERLRSWFASGDNGFVVDVKGFFDRKAMADAGLTLWRL